MWKWGIACVVLVAALLLGAPSYGPALGLGPASPPEPGERVELGDGVFVNVIDEGQGIPVVLVHGHPGSAYDWPPLPARLVAAGYRVLRYDRVGYGHSSRRKRDEDHHYTANARELLALVEVKSLDRPVLVGWSFGGGVVQQALADSKARARAAVLIASVGPAPITREDSPGILERVLRSESVTRWGIRSGFVARPGTRALSTEAFSGEPPEGWTEQTLALLAIPGASRALVMEDTYRTALAAPEGIRVPTLVLHGTDDRLVPFEVGLDLERRIPGARLAIADRGSHMLPVTHADWIVAQLGALVGNARR